MLWRVFCCGWRRCCCRGGPFRRWDLDDDDDDDDATLPRLGLDRGGDDDDGLDFVVLDEDDEEIDLDVDVDELVVVVVVDGSASFQSSDRLGMCWGSRRRCGFVSAEVLLLLLA